MSLPTFYIPPADISGDTATLTGDELRHARTTLRLGAGDAVRIVDGEGTSCRGLIRTLGKEGAELSLSGREVEPEPAFRLTAAMGIVQGERFDWAIQKGTELGIACFIPLVTGRTEITVRGSWKRLDRLRRVIVSAAKQCGRARFPSLREPVPLGELDTGPYDRAIVFWEEEPDADLHEISRKGDRPSSCLMVIGPVGGLTAEEIGTLREKGCLVAGMGPRILRTETAVTAGAALLQFLWGDMG